MTTQLTELEFRRHIVEVPQGGYYDHRRNVVPDGSSGTRVRRPGHDRTGRLPEHRDLQTGQER